MHFYRVMSTRGVDLEPQPELRWAGGRAFFPDFQVRGTGRFFEIDSQAHHGSPWQRRRDARRDRRVRELGGDVRRIEGRDVLSGDPEVLRDALSFARGTPAGWTV
jgi:very-short-patch-repair endonuclease